MKKYIEFINENNDIIPDLERMYDITEFKYCYRWVGQPGLYEYLYGTFEKEDVLVENNKEKKRVDVMDLSYLGKYIPMTVDPGYIGEPRSGEAIIRLVFDLQKLIKDFKYESFLTNGEAEIRFTEPIIDFTKYLIRLDINQEAYDDDYESEFGTYKAMKNYIPNDLPLNFFPDEDFAYDRRDKIFRPVISKHFQKKNGLDMINKLIRIGRL